MRFIIFSWKHKTSECCRHSRQRRYSILLRSTSIIFFLAVQAAFAQTHESAFCEVRTFPLPEKFEKCLLVPIPLQSVTSLVAWTAHRNEILLATFNSTMSSVDYTLKRTAMEFDDLSVADFNNDGSPDLLLVNKQERTIATVLHLLHDTLQIAGKIKLPFEPEQILLGDYNNDKHLDLLVYAHNIPGILPLVGNGKGRFVLGKIIAEDNGIGAADFAHMNNDNLIDLIIWDWVKSELHVLYGVGRGRFIDQSNFPVKGDVDVLVATPIIRGHTLDLVLKMRDPSGFQIWEGNDYGDFQLKSHIAIDGRVTGFAIADVNDDNLNDLIISVNPASLQVAFNDDAEAFSESVEYACGNDPQKVLITSPQSGNMKDCIVFDRGAGQFIVFKNAGSSGDFSDSLLVITGVSPEEIIADDFNKDGISDIALLNLRSQSLSLYFGQKNSAPSGPVFYSLTEKPKHIAFHSSTDTTLQFILSFPLSNQISYLVIDSANNSVSNAFIGTEGDAQVVDAALNERHQAEFATWNRKGSEGNSLSFYEQIGLTTFIERSFHLSSPDNLLGASVADLNGDGIRDIVYVYQADGNSKAGLGIAFGDSTYSMKQRIISRELSLTTSKQVYIWLADFDRDNFLDMLIQTGSPDGYFAIAIGKGDGYFNDPVYIADSLSISDRSEVQIVDVDGDGLLDIAVGSQRFGCVYWLRNKNNCNFSRKEVLFVEKGLGRFVIADIDADGIKDLAMTLTRKGFMKIINGKHLIPQIKTGE
jgi:hypothetical protein